MCFLCLERLNSFCKELSPRGSAESSPPNDDDKESVFVCGEKESDSDVELVDVCRPVRSVGRAKKPAAKVSVSDASGLVQEPGRSSAARKQTGKRAFNADSLFKKPPKKKRDEELYSLYTITHLPGGGVSVTCNHCPGFNKTLQRTNATKLREHSTNKCPGIDAGTKRRLIQGSQRYRRNQELYVLSADPNESMSDMRKRAEQSRMSPSSSSAAVIDLSGGDSPSSMSSLSSDQSTKYAGTTTSVLVRNGNMRQPDIQEKFGKAMDVATATLIILAEVKAMLARGEPLHWLMDHYVQGAVIVRNPGLGHFLPKHEDTICNNNNYVIPIDQKAFTEMKDFLNRLPGWINVAMDGATINGKQKVRLICSILTD